MGWWAENQESTAFWGDEPADQIDLALEKVHEIFKREFGRDATRFELRRGLEFAMASPALKEKPGD